MQQVKTVEDLLRGGSVHGDESVFEQPKWLAKKGVTMIPADDPKVGWFGFVLFDKKGNEGWPVRQVWPKAKPVEHKRFHALVKALSDFVSKDILCLKCYEPKRLLIGFLALRGSGIEWHTASVVSLKAWYKKQSKSVSGEVLREFLCEERWTVLFKAIQMSLDRIGSGIEIEYDHDKSKNSKYLAFSVKMVPGRQKE